MSAVACCESLAQPASAVWGISPNLSEGARAIACALMPLRLRRWSRSGADHPDVGPDARAVVLVHERSAPPGEGPVVVRGPRVGGGDDRAGRSDLRQFGVGQ